MKYLFLKAFLALVFMSIFFSGKALAADWPNAVQWSYKQDYSLTGEAVSPIDDDYNMTIQLEKGFTPAGVQTHDDRNAYFNAYIYGDSRSNGGSFTVTFNRYPGTALNGATMMANSGSVTASTNSNSNFNLNIPYNGGIYIPERDITAYKIRAWVPAPSPEPSSTYGYRFRVSSAQVNRFGFLANNTIPFSSALTGRGTFQNLKFQLATQCVGDSNGSVVLYDSDNAKDFNIQNGFGWLPSAPPGGWTGYGEYFPLRMRLLDASNAQQFAFSNSSNDTDSYWTNSGGYYVPVNGNSGATMGLSYAFNPNSVYKFELNHFGIANYVSISMPLDEDPGRPCVSISKTTSTTLTDYEKGSTDLKQIIHSVTIDPCIASEVVFTVTGKENNGSLYNRQINHTFNPATEGCTYNYVVTINGVWLDGQPPGTSIAYATDASTKNMLVYEVPFVKFTGQDVRACSDASENRFMYDPTNSYNGSNSVLASIFKAANSDPPLYMGLPTTAGGAIDRLRTNWDSGAGCVTSGIEDLSVNNGSPHLYIDSDSNASSLPEITYVNGNIYIDPSVTLINKKILIATGSIFTCSTGLDGTGAIQPPTADWDTKCRNNLVVNGALYADTIYFQRSVGTRLLDGTPGINGSTAETINFPSEMNFKDYLPPSGSGKFSSFRSVSPRL